MKKPSNELESALRNEPKIRLVRISDSDSLGEEVASAKFSTSLRGAPDGEYVVFQFKSSIGNKASALETVTAMKDPDDTWRLAGYFIKGPETPDKLTGAATAVMFA